jgi:hypothetical protein
MTWTEAGEILITQKETVLPVIFDAPALAIKAIDFFFLKASWNWAGYFIQTITVPVIGQIRIEEKIDLSTKEATLIVPKLYESEYQLIFYKAEWIPQFKLIIYENNMPIYNAQDTVIFPSNKYATSTATSVAPATTSTALLAANANRKGVLVANNTNQVMVIERGATASLAAASVTLAAKTAGGLVSVWEDDDYTGAISAICANAASGAWNVREFS